MQRLKRNQSNASLRRIYFTLVDDIDLHSRETGKSGSAVVKISKNGAAAATGGGTVGEVDAGDQPGHYYYETTQAELSDIGVGTLYVTATGCEPRDVEFAVEHDPYGEGVARLLGLTHENSMIDNVVTTGGNMTAARIRVFDDAAALGAASAGAADDADGETQRYLVTAAYSGSDLTSYQIVRDL